VKRFDRRPGLTRVTEEENKPRPSEIADGQLPKKPSLRPAEVADYLDVSLVTVYKLIEEGIIPALKTNPLAHGHYRIPRHEFLLALDTTLRYEPEF
jgi:excisionase family DNA binding protein